MPSEIRKLKDASIVGLLEFHEEGVRGSTLEAHLRDVFPGQVSKRFRSEVEGLIKTGVITREGTGPEAMFKLKRKTKNKPTTSSQPSQVSPEPTPEPPAQITQEPPFDRMEIRVVVEPVLAYLLRNGARTHEVVIRKNQLHVISWRLKTYMKMLDHGLITEQSSVPIMVEVTREGRRCLDAARAGETWTPKDPAQ